MAAGWNTTPPEKREAVLEDIKAGTKSARQIAKDHDVSVSTVSSWAKQEGLTNAFDRSKTEAATQAHAIDCRAAREALKAQLIADAEKIRQRAWSKYETIIDSRAAGPTTMSLDLPPLADVRAAYAAVGLAIDKHCRLEQYDATDSAADAKSFLGDLAEAFGIANRHLNTEPPETA